jgi:alpha-glucosidase
MLALTRRLLLLRREHPALAEGEHRSVDGVPDGTFCFVRAAEGDSGGSAVLVALNLTGEQREVAIRRGSGRILEATHPDRIDAMVDTSSLQLRPDEGLVVELEGS